MIHLFFKLVAWFFFRVKVHGEENVKGVQGPLLIIANHISLLDGPLLHLYLPLKYTFLIDKTITEQKMFKPFLSQVNYKAVDIFNPYSIRDIIRGIKNGENYMIFPEGRLSVTGGFMKVEDGLGMIAEKTGVRVLPVYIKGAEKTKFTYIPEKLGAKWFAKVEIFVNKPVKLKVPEGLKRAETRKQLSEQMFSLFPEIFFRAHFQKNGVFHQFVQTVRREGRKKMILEDSRFEPVGYGRLLLGCFLLGRRITLGYAPQNIGILLPNSAACLISFLGMLAYRKTPAMLNFTSGADTLRKVCKVAGITRIITSRAFIEKGKLEGLIEGLSGNFEIFYLEDVREDLSTKEKLSALWKSRFPASHLPKCSMDDTALILFTSGSEGMPKGVALSHSNILSNVVQCTGLLSLTNEDRFFNALPMFHAFGIIPGTLLPVLRGIPVFLYPSPLHFRNIPALVYQKNCTLMFGTDTFYSGYARKGHPYEFRSLRYAIAGAEKLKEETKTVWAQKFGIRVFEGYGCTEASPVLCVNTPILFKEGSVGKFLPGIEYKLEKIEGFEKGKKLWVKGPNIMKHYILEDGIHPPKEGWYDTGDVVEVDGEGYVTILGRAKRFAKIAGEMVSLQAVEEYVAKVWPDFGHISINVPDPRKGERIVLLTENPNPERSELVTYVRSRGLSELSIPREILSIDSIPVSGTGKADFKTAKEIYLQQKSNSSAKEWEDDDEDEEILD